MQKKWITLPEAPKEFLDTHADLSPLVATLLYNRNIRTKEAIHEFLNPSYKEHVHDPFLFRDMQKAVDRLYKAIENNEKITIHGDYDADGVSGSVILKSFFNAMNYDNVDCFLPHRDTDGYGLNLKNVQLLADQGTNVIISCDCGISNAPEVELANSLGLDVIITDHHSIPPTIPPAHAIIHPKIPDEPYPDKTLAGGAVAFKLVQALLIEHAKTNETLPNGEPHAGFEKWLLDMVAISTVADMVPLTGESRTLTTFGLLVLNKTRRIGMIKLLKQIGIMNEDNTLTKEIDAGTIGFSIAPRINAAGRIGHANVAYDLFMARSGADAIDMAYLLEQNNDERRKLTADFVEQATNQVYESQKDNPVLFVYSSDWYTGIVGLIAGQIKEKFGKPTIAMTANADEAMGSCRSIEGFNMIEALQSMPEMFAKFGGHPMACGFTLASHDTREAFQKKLTEYFIEKTKDLDLTPELSIDAEIDLDDITYDLFEELRKFRPYGQENPSPKYLTRGLEVVDLKGVGRDSRHLSIQVRHNGGRIRKTIGWNLCDGSNNGIDWSKKIKIGDTIDLVYEISENIWKGNRELQLTIVDIKKS